MDDVRRPERDLTTADIAGAGPREERRAPADPAATPAREEERVRAVPVEARAVPVEAEEDRGAPLVEPGTAEELRRRWSEIQTGFVDEPRESVERADGLVAEAIKLLAETFAAERQRLESQWERGTDVSTEDLRQALRRYRSFFDRLLSV